MTNYSVNANCGETLFSFFGFEYWILRIVAVSLLIVSVLFGNILILTSIIKYRRHYKGFMFELIGHLAVVDIILSLGLSIHMTEFASTYVLNSHLLCALKLFCVTTAVTCSSKFLLMLSIDRFFAIVHPLKHLIKSSELVKRRFVIVSVWTASIFISSYTAIKTYLFAESSPNFTCLYADLLPSELSLFTSSYIIFQFIVCTLLGVIAIWKLKTNNMSKLRFKKSIMKYRLILRINSLYLLCWSPYIVTSFLVETMPNGNENHALLCVRSYAIIFGCLHSGSNWIINGVANKKFRNRFINILKCRKETDNNQIPAVQSNNVVTRE